jgi:nucleoside-diphosphate-sugar epimerase
VSRSGTIAVPDTLLRAPWVSGNASRERSGADVDGDRGDPLNKENAESVGALARPPSTECRAAKPARVVVTGSEGLVGTALVARLRAAGHYVRRFDLRASDAESRGDVRDAARLRSLLSDCDGVVHLAAVSRVITAEREPEVCWHTNVDALRQLLAVAAASRHQPWVVFVSSREVYGQAAKLPAAEDTPLVPVNVYGRSKVAGEALCAEARARGHRVAVVRLSNAFGSTADHFDRVVPAFVRAALTGEPLRVDGPSNTFDFTYVDDAAAGLSAVVELLAVERAAPEAIHLVTGIPTTLGDLAALVVRLTESRSSVCSAPARAFDVARFVGDPSRAFALLGWRAEVPLEAGLRRLIEAFRRESAR